MAAALIDLCTVAQVQAFLDPEGSVVSWLPNQQAEQQALITEGSQNWLQWTGRRTLNRPMAFNDTVDGSGSDRLYLPDYPIIKVFNVWVNGALLPAGSNGPSGVTPGWVIDRTRQSLSIVGLYDGGLRAAGAFRITGTSPSRRFGTLGFGSKDNNNRQNVLVQYVAGPSFANPEVAIVPGTSPYIYQVTNGSTFTQDAGVISMSTGQPFTAVASNPGPGQYVVSSLGTYTFNAFDSGTSLTFYYAYAGAPFDLQLAVAEMVGINWTRLKTKDVKTSSTSGNGADTYRDWIFTPKVERTLEMYKRRVGVGV